MSKSGFGKVWERLGGAWGGAPGGARGGALGRAGFAGNRSEFQSTLALLVYIRAE